MFKVALLLLCVSVCFGDTSFMVFIDDETIRVDLNSQQTFTVFNYSVSNSIQQYNNSTKLTVTKNTHFINNLDITANDFVSTIRIFDVVLELEEYDVYVITPDNLWRNKYYTSILGSKYKDYYLFTGYQFNNSIIWVQEYDNSKSSISTRADPVCCSTSMINSFDIDISCSCIGVFYAESTGGSIYIKPGVVITALHIILSATSAIQIEGATLLSEDTQISAFTVEILKLSILRTPAESISSFCSISTLSAATINDSSIFFNTVNIDITSSIDETGAILARSSFYATNLDINVSVYDGVGLHWDDCSLVGYENPSKSFLTISSNTTYGSYGVVMNAGSGLSNYSPFQQVSIDGRAGDDPNTITGLSGVLIMASPQIEFYGAVNITGTTLAQETNTAGVKLEGFFIFDGKTQIRGKGHGAGVLIDRISSKVNLEIAGVSRNLGISYSNLDATGFLTLEGTISEVSTSDTAVAIRAAYTSLTNVDAYFVAHIYNIGLLQSIGIFTGSFEEDDTTSCSFTVDSAGTMGEIIGIWWQSGSNSGLGDYYFDVNLYATDAAVGLIIDNSSLEKVVLTIYIESNINNCQLTYGIQAQRGGFLASFNAQNIEIHSTNCEATFGIFFDTESSFQIYDSSFNFNIEANYAFGCYFDFSYPEIINSNIYFEINATDTSVGLYSQSTTFILRDAYVYLDLNCDNDCIGAQFISADIACTSGCHLTSVLRGDCPGCIAIDFSGFLYGATEGDSIFLSGQVKSADSTTIGVLLRDSSIESENQFLVEIEGMGNDCGIRTENTYFKANTLILNGNSTLFGIGIGLTDNFGIDILLNNAFDVDKMYINGSSVGSIGVRISNFFVELGLDASCQIQISGSGLISPILFDGSFSIDLKTCSFFLENYFDSDSIYLFGSDNSEVVINDYGFVNGFMDIETESLTISNGIEGLNLYSTATSFLCGNLNFDGQIEFLNDIISICTYVDIYSDNSFVSVASISTHDSEEGSQFSLYGYSVTINGDIGTYYDGPIASLTIGSEYDILLKGAVIQTINNQRFIGRNITHDGNELTLLSLSGQIQFESSLDSQHFPIAIKGNSLFYAGNYASVMDLRLFQGTHIIDGSIIGYIGLENQVILSGTGYLDYVEILGVETTIDPSFVSADSKLYIDTLVLTSPTKLFCRIEEPNYSWLYVYDIISLGNYIELGGDVVIGIINPPTTSKSIGGPSSSNNYYYPLTTNNAFPDIVDINGLVGEYDTATIASSNFIASYLIQTPNYLSTSDKSFSLHINSLPTANDDVCSTNCSPQSICECCVDVLANDTDPDILDVLTIHNIQPGLYIDAFNQLCHSSYVDLLSVAEIQYYEAIDNAGGISNTAIIHYTFTIPTPSVSSTQTPSISFSATPTIPASSSQTPSISDTSSQTTTNTYTQTLSPTVTPSTTNTNSNTPTSSNTETPSNTGTPPISRTNTPSSTPTATGTSSVTPTSTISASTTSFPTSSNTNTPTNTGTPTNSATYSISNAITLTPTGTVTSTNTPTKTSTLSLSNTPSNTGTQTASKTSTNTPTPTSTTSVSPTQSKSPTASSSETSSPTSTITQTPTTSNTSSKSLSITSPPSLSNTISLSASESFSNTISISPSKSHSGSSSRSSSNTLPASKSASISNSNTPSSSSTNSRSAQSSLTPTITNSPTSSKTPSPSETSSLSVSFSHTPSSSESPSKSRTDNFVFVQPPEPLASQSVIPNLNIASNTPTPSSTRTITSALDACSTNCDMGEVGVTINSNQNNNNQDKQPVVLQSSNGQLLGSLIIPEDIGGSDSNLVLQANYIVRDPNQNNNDNIGDIIIDITLVDEFGVQITNLEEPLTICLSDSSNVSKFLSFLF